MPDRDDCPNQPQMLEEVELINNENKHANSENKHIAAWRSLLGMDQSLNSRTAQNSVEIKIGLFWLHKMGIACLVFGFAFLIMYSFQFLGPQLKLMIGAAVSAGARFGTLARIICFIGVGVVVLASSYVHALFTRKFDRHLES
jgi:uncharacterized membrane protein